MTFPEAIIAYGQRASLLAVTLAGGEVTLLDACQEVGRKAV